MQKIAATLTGRRSSWVILILSLLAITLLFGVLRGAEGHEGNETAPSASESSRVNALLDEFPDADQQSVIVVAERTDREALSDSDLVALDELRGALDATTGHTASPPTVSDDGEAAVIVTPMTVGASNTETAGILGDLRDTVHQQTPVGIQLWVTGGPAFGADVAAAFDGADFTLLIVTIAIVAVLLIITYRSPILWIVPLAVVAIADGLAGRATAAAGGALGLQFDGGIISVLVFGAGANYALLLISRYREELFRTDDHRTALAAAWRGTAGTILASNLTVVFALATLALAVIPGTHGLGIASAIGLLIALVAVLFVLPPLLAVCGRRVFWPFVPRPENAAASGRVWRGIAERVVRRPALSLTAGLAVLGIMAAGLVGATVGLQQNEQFRVPSESAAGLDVLSAHFAPGEAQPIIVVANTTHADAVARDLADAAGIVRAHPIGESTDGTLTEIMVTSEYAPGTQESLAQITELRDRVHDIDGADALVGGHEATDADARAGNERDLLVVAPLILLVSLVVLVVLLRSLVAPILLLIVNLLSAAAAIGAGTWLSRILFDQHALDTPVPLLAFLFLVALGIDYTIFLVHRARHEAMRWGTRRGMVEAVSHTGAVITSAGIVLAAVFAALGVLPLVALGQLGLIVGVGVVIDTIVVRTGILPALFALVGDAMWWPSRPAVTAPSGVESEHDASVGPRETTRSDRPHLSRHGR